MILSAYGDMSNIRTAMNRGAFDFLMKPLDFADFETTLRRTQEALQAARDALAARSQLNAIQQELEIAARIQASILPREFCPERDDFHIYAEMTPARVVGGDFYDFFLDRREAAGLPDRRRLGEGNSGGVVHGGEPHAPAGDRARRA